MAANFADRLCERVFATNSRLCVGCDPEVALLPAFAGRGRPHKTPVAAIKRFGFELLPAVAPHAAAVKFQSAFYERFGAAGVRVLEHHLAAARAAGLITILDCKRGDVGHTMRAYCDAYLAPGAPLEADAVTLSPYLGSGGLAAFNVCAGEYGKGYFVVVKSSNPSTADVQDVRMEDGRPLCHRVAEMTAGLGRRLLGTRGYSAAGAVVGATHPESLAALRALMPEQFFLLPGVGAQGGEVARLGPAFDAQGLGGLVAASRSVAFAWRERPDVDWREAAAAAARELNAAVNAILSKP
jgi:orotidine-5'-phosphate decarboxylase